LKGNSHRKPVECSYLNPKKHVDQIAIPWLVEIANPTVAKKSYPLSLPLSGQNLDEIHSGWLKLPVFHLNFLNPHVLLVKTIIFKARLPLVCC